MYPDIAEIIELANMTHYQIHSRQITINNLGVPHIPQDLLEGHRGLYFFIINDQYYKIGKAGENANSRFKYQHYLVHGNGSTLARSIIRDNIIPNVNEENIQDYLL